MECLHNFIFVAIAAKVKQFKELKKSELQFSENKEMLDDNIYKINEEVKINVLCKIKVRNNYEVVFNTNRTLEYKVIIYNGVQLANSFVQF